MLLMLPHNKHQETILPSNASIAMIKYLVQKHKADVHPCETAVLMNSSGELSEVLNLAFKFSAPLSAE